MIDKLNELGIECILSQSNTIMTKSHFNVKFLGLLQMNGVSVVPDQRIRDLRMAR